MLKIPPKTEYVINTLIKNGYEAYIVGGCVRDMLLGNTPFDYDVTTSATPNQVTSLFEKTVPTGIKHGTVTVIVDKEPIEVTTFRTESGYNDNRHPESVTFVTSLKDDLARRDFTVNAIAYNNTSGLQDYFGGITDLKNRVLRAVGVASSRFSEDALRILRLFRFSSVLSFEIEKETLSAAIKLSQSLANISRERIATELKKAVIGKNVSALEPLIKCGGLDFLSVKKAPDFEIIKKSNDTEKLALFSFFYLSDCDVLKISSALKLSNEYKAYFEKMFVLCNSKFPKSKPEIKEMLKNSSVEIFRDYLIFSKARGKDTTKQGVMLTEIFENNEPYLVSHLKISGKDLEALGFKGEKIGQILEILRKTVVAEPQKNTYQQLLEIIKTL